MRLDKYNTNVAVAVALEISSFCALFFATFSTLFTSKCGKKKKTFAKQYFIQLIQCAAPICWSKYSTEINYNRVCQLPRDLKRDILLEITLGPHKFQVGLSKKGFMKKKAPSRIQKKMVNFVFIYLDR